MTNKLLLGFWRLLLPLPTSLWESRLPKMAQETYDGLAWMSEDHHRVREFVVLEIARQGKPLSPAYIAQALGLPDDRLAIILDELERGMTFLFRNEHGQVSWAYPVTADRTPHAVKLNTGDQFHAA